MEMLEGKEAESINSKDWDELFNLFAKMLASEKQGLIIRAIVKLAKMSRYAPENILELAVPMLLELLQSPSLLVNEASAYCLKRISSRGEGAFTNLIGHPPAISTILRRLQRSRKGLRGDLLKCLRNVVTFCTNSRAILVSNGGLRIVLDMIDYDWSDTKLVLFEILSSLALLEEVRMFLVGSDKVHLLVEASKCGSMISRTRAAQAIGLLAFNKPARRELVFNRVIPALINLLDVGDPPAKLVAGNALGAVFSCIRHVRLLNARSRALVISSYVELLEGSDVIGKEIAMDVLCVLATFEENAIPIIEHLMRILRGNNRQGKTAAFDVLWDLSSHQCSFPVLRNASAISVLVELLEDESIDVREKVVGAIAQLSQNVADRAFLANCGAIPRLLNLLDSESDELRDNAAEALVDFSLDSSLGDQISCVMENPMFQNIRDGVMMRRATIVRMRSRARDEIITAVGRFRSYIFNLMEDEVLCETAEPLYHLDLILL